MGGPRVPGAKTRTFNLKEITGQKIINRLRARGLSTIDLRMISPLIDERTPAKLPVESGIKEPSKISIEGDMFTMEVKRLWDVNRLTEEFPGAEAVKKGLDRQGGSGAAQQFVGVSRFSLDPAVARRLRNILDPSRDITRMNLGAADRRGSDKRNNNDSSKAPEKADNKDKVNDVFDPELLVLLHELRHQKRVGKPLTVDERFFYVTSDQAAEFADYIEQLGGMDTSIYSDITLQAMLEQLDVTRPVTVVDLGVGPQIVAPDMYRKMVKYFDIVEYLGVDYSQRILDLAMSHADRVSLPVNTRFKKLNFHDVSEKPDVLLGEINTEQAVYLMAGGTYANFSPDQMQAFLKGIMNPGNMLIAQLSYYNGMSSIENVLMRVRDNKELVEDDKLSPLYGLGFQRSDVEFKYKYVEKEEAMVATAKIKRVPEALRSHNAYSANLLSKGDTIELFRARKPRLTTLRREIEKVDLKVTFHEYDDNGFPVAIGVVTK